MRNVPWSHRDRAVTEGDADSEILRGHHLSARLWMIGRLWTSSFQKEGGKGIPGRDEEESDPRSEKTPTALGDKRAAPLGRNICRLRGDVERQDLTTRGKPSGLLRRKMEAAHRMVAGQALQPQRDNRSILSSSPHFTGKVFHQPRCLQRTESVIKLLSFQVEKKGS